MKSTTYKLLALACAACATPAIAESTPSAKQLQSYQKNLARQHLSSNLFLFDGASQRFVATEAAAAWLDDDVSTGWPALAGKQHYALQFSEPQVLSNFSLSTAPVEGTVTLYSGDEMKNPGDPAWRVIAKDVPVASINQKKLAKSFNRQAKYLLIETNIVNPGPIFSLYAYGQRSAANEMITKRAEKIDVATLGEFINEQTSFNVSSIYSQGRVTYGNGSTAPVGWQKAIDDNAETAAIVKSSTDSGMVVSFGDSRTVSRLSMLTDLSAKGKVDIFLLAEAPAAGHPVALEGVQPSLSLTFDGSNSRASADFDDTTAVAMAVRWTPATAGQDLNVLEINTFANLSLADYEVTNAPVAIAEGPAKIDEATPRSGETAKTDNADRPSDRDDSKTANNNRSENDGKEIAPIGEGKETVDYKGGSGKESKEIIAAGPAPTGYFPGGLGFPPNLSSGGGRDRTPKPKFPSP